MKLIYEGMIGRQFEHGKTDCYDLIRTFYQVNFGIELRDYARPDDWWNQGMNLYIENFPREGFYPIDVPMNFWRPGDILLMGIQSPVANHAAIVVEGGRLLHHLWGRLSLIEPYRLLYRNCTLATLRHKDVTFEQEEEEVDLADLLPDNLKEKVRAYREASSVLP